MLDEEYFENTENQKIKKKKSLFKMGREDFYAVRCALLYFSHAFRIYKLTVPYLFI